MNTRGRRQLQEEFARQSRNQSSSAVRCGGCMLAAIIGREIAMSALREWAASVSQEAHKAAAVSQLGKWKTTTQASPTRHTRTLNLDFLGASVGSVRRPFLRVSFGSAHSQSFGPLADGCADTTAFHQPRGRQWMAADFCFAGNPTLGRRRFFDCLLAVRIHERPLEVSVLSASR